MYNPLILIDFYKATHAEQYPQGFTRIYSPGTPRMSRLPDIDRVVYFGGQGYCKTILIEAFNTHFFNRTEEEVMTEYNHCVGNPLGRGAYGEEKIRSLHRLGYLPIAMYAVPEGTETAIGVPQSVFVNTHPGFAWLTNTLETSFSSYIWHIQISAEVGKRYRKIVQKYRDLTCDESVRVVSLLGDFSMRGQHCPESAMTSSAAWLLSFRNTATVPAIKWLEDNYNCNTDTDEVGYGAVSFEHSTVTSNFAVDGDEISLIKRALTEIYPNTSFSFVSDSYDYDNVVMNLIPQCKEEIMNHKGYFAVRGDSGDPVEVMAGKKIHWLTPHDDEEKAKLFIDADYTASWFDDWCRDDDLEDDCTEYFHYNGKFYRVDITCEWTNERGAWTDRKYYYVEDFNVEWEEISPSLELLGTVWALDQTFGHTINSKGFKVLPDYIRALYGDSITPQRCEEIYKRLTAQGYAINNVILGVGSFSFMCLETIDENGDPHYNPYTRDTFGYAIKATYGEDKDGNPVMIYKNPKALAWKKSQRGCVIVAPDGMSYTDGHTFAEAHSEDVNNLLQLVFKDGKMVREFSLDEVRKNMYPEGF
jgi:nicotinamide phosphoribosyltransferase